MFYVDESSALIDFIEFLLKDDVKFDVERLSPILHASFEISSVETVERSFNVNVEDV